MTYLSFQSVLRKTQCTRSARRKTPLDGAIRSGFLVARRTRPCAARHGGVAPVEMLIDASSSVELTGLACVWNIVRSSDLHLPPRPVAKVVTQKAHPPSNVMVQRPNEVEFLSEVLGTIEDLPEGFAERLAKLVADKPEDRAEAIRRLIEEHSGD